MIPYRLIDRPAFEVVGRKTYISGPDNAQFGRFWQECRGDGLLDTFWRLRHDQPGPQTNGLTLGISRVEQDPARRDFHYMIAIEKPADGPPSLLDGLEVYRVPAARWAAFECRGKVPDSIVQAEMFAFMDWLPASGFEHALAPEMEVYPSAGDDACEFWLPIRPKS